MIATKGTEGFDGKERKKDVETIGTRGVGVLSIN